MVYLVDFGMQVVTLHVLCVRTEPSPSLDLIPTPQYRTPKPVDDTTDDLLSLEHSSKTSLPCRKAALIEAYKKLLVFFCLSEKVVRPKPDRPDRFHRPCTHIILQATDTGESWQQGYESVRFVAQNSFLHWGV